MALIAPRCIFELPPIRSQNVRRLVLVLALGVSPCAAVAQTPRDTVTLTVLVQGSSRVYGQQVDRARSGEGFASQPKEGGGIPTVPLSGAVVALKGGADLGTTNDQGRVTIRFAYAERVDLVIRLKEYKDLNCRVRVKEPVDSVRAELLPAMGVAAWMPFGCKALR